MMSLAGIVDAAISETGATSMKDLGKVMKAVMPRLAGQNVDGKLVNELVRKRLGTSPLASRTTSRDKLFARDSRLCDRRLSTSLSSILLKGRVASAAFF